MTKDSSMLQVRVTLHKPLPIHQAATVSTTKPAHSFIVTRSLPRRADNHDQPHTTSSTTTSPYRSRSPLPSAVRLPSPERVNHQPSHLVARHTRTPYYAGSRFGGKTGIDGGMAARQRRSASPRGVRQLQRECDTLVLIWEKQRYEGAMRRKEQLEVQDREGRELDYGNE